MCGIAGIVSVHPSGTSDLYARASAMSSTMEHRGPDDAGVWQNGDRTVALAHRRLAILDLSPAGHQPMHSADRNWTVVFNGEIYNFKQIRDELRHRYEFVSHSDTEVLLAALQLWGSERTLQRIRGMFAFAAWNQAERKLLLARDRIGEKPLYFAYQNGELLFFSELRALATQGAFQRNIRTSAVASLLQFGYIPDPNCIFDDVRKLRPGTYVAVGSRAGSRDVRVEFRVAPEIEQVPVVVRCEEEI